MALRETTNALNQLTFLAAVRGGAVPHPTQKGFTTSQWDNAFGHLGVPNSRDHIIHRLGLWYAQRLTHTRKAWEQLPRLDLPKERLLRLLVGALNFQVESVRADNPGVLHKVSLEGLAGSVDHGYFPHGDLVGQVQHLLESARIVLANAALGLEPSASPLPSPTAGDIIAGLRQRTGLATHYAALESFWAESLWNDWDVLLTEGGDIIAPTNLEREIWRTTGGHRAASLHLEGAYHTHDVWASSPGWMRKASLPRLQVTALKREGRALRIILGPPPLNASTPPLEFVHQLAAADPYIQHVEDEPLPGLANVSLRQILHGRAVFAPLADLLRARLPLGTDINSLGALLQCAPGLGARELMRALSIGAGLTHDQARTLLALWTFDGSHRSDLWQRPFIRVSRGALAPILPALRSPNLQWLIGYWLKIGGLDLTKRGPAFEQEVRLDLSRAARLRDCLVRDCPLHFSVGKASEEFDLVIQIGNLVLLGEIKCVLHPADPYDYHRLESLLLEASTQIARKCEFATLHATRFLATLGSAVSSANATFFPFILTNLPEATGFPGPVPVVDLHILRRYLREGYIEAFAARARDGFLPGTRIPFYSDEQEAAQHCPSYLRLPPQLKLLRNQFSLQTRQLYSFEGERPLSFQCPRIRPPDVIHRLRPPTE